MTHRNRCFPTGEVNTHRARGHYTGPAASLLIATVAERTDKGRRRRGSRDKAPEKFVAWNSSARNRSGTSFRQAVGASETPSPGSLKGPPWSRFDPVQGRAHLLQGGAILRREPEALGPPEGPVPVAQPDVAVPCPGRGTLLTWLETEDGMPLHPRLVSAVRPFLFTLLLQ